MYADAPQRTRRRVDHGSDVRLSYDNIIGFVAKVLPEWRDDPDRPPNDAEVRLTNHLADALNRAAHLRFDAIKFSPETPDDSVGGRTLDLAAKPLYIKVELDGRLHSVYDILLPIECKRLPTPKGVGRDEREYVHSASSSTGGIQRFKVGLHGARHPRGVLIGYMQSGTSEEWHTTINGWLEAMAGTDASWHADEQLSVVAARPVQRRRSTHRRSIGGLPATPVTLDHLWIDLSPG